MSKALSILTASQSVTATRYIQPETLTASADEDARELTGLVLPFGKPGRTSRGKLSVTASALQIPEDLKRVKLYRDHSDVGGTPVGYATAAEIKEDGLYMSFRVGATPDGDAALVDVSEGIRDALSVELVSPQISGSQITAAQLSAVAIVAVPAYEDARVQSTPKPAAKSVMSRLVTRDVITAGNNDNSTLTLHEVSNALVARLQGDSTHEDLTAALGQITVSGNPKVTSPTWLGELWNGQPYTRLIVPTMGTATLTDMTLSGWRWVTRPEVDDYAGNLAEIPTNSPTTEPYTVEAKRLAGGHKLDRKYIDFPNAEFIQSYLREMARSYAEKTDARAATYIVGQSTAVLQATSQADLLRAAGKARQIMKRTARVEPTTYLVNSDDLFALMDLTALEKPEFLDILGVDPAAFVDDPAVPAGRVIAYHKEALKFGELPGSPIRVNADDVARGGTDEALFGYYAPYLEDSRGLVAVPFGAAAGE